MQNQQEATQSTARINFGARSGEASQNPMPVDATVDDFEESTEETGSVAEGAAVEQASDTETVSAASSEDAQDEAPTVEIEAPAAPANGQKTVEELAAERERIDAEIRAQQQAQKTAVIDQIKAVMLTYHISLEELVDAMGGLKIKRKGVKAKQKYRDPISGKTWSGRGKEPVWIRGKNREDFLIPEDEQFETK